MHDREESVFHADDRRAFVTPATADVRVVLEQEDRSTASGKSDDDSPAEADEQARVVPTMWR